MELTKFYIVTACGNSKKDKRPYSILHGVRETQSGQWIDDKDFMKIDTIKPVGTKLRAKTIME